MVATTNVFSGSAIQDVPIHTSSEDMNDNKEDKKDDKESKNKLKKDCHKITIDVFELLSSAVDQRILTSKDRKNYMEALSDKNLEDGGALTLEKKKEFLENLQRYAPSFVSEAQTMTSKFISDIEEAKKKGWISENSAKRWLERLEMRSTDWPSTKEFLNNFNKKYMDNWKNLAKKREQAKNEIKKLKVTEKEIPELIKFNDVGFNDWHYSIKSEVIDTTLTQLALHDEKNQKNYQLYNKTKTILEREVKMGVMRKDQSAMWLESLFNRKRPNEEIESIIKGKLTEYVGEWAKLRYRFDRIIRRMSKGVAQGANEISEKEFMNMKFEEKKSYIQETEYTLDLVEKGTSNRPIDKMKLEIRSLIAQKDWEGAKYVLKQAQNIAEGEDEYELKSMERNIAIFREEPEEFPGETASELLENLRSIVMSEVPSGLHTLYIQALNAGPEVFASISTLMYNRVWCWNNGHLDGEKEEIKYKESIGETMDIIQNGHDEEAAENVSVNMMNTEQNVNAIRPYKKTWKPTLLHLNASDGSACAKLISELKGKNAARDYWTTLIVNNISFENQSALTKGVNQRIKSGIRKLHRMGVGFSLTGPPPSLN